MISGKKTLPLVSVVISTRNRADSLRETMDNLLLQDYPSLEIVVVDDASSDSTQMVIRDFLEQHSNIRTLLNPTNAGLPTSLNRGIQLASGTYIARIDDHDFWTDPQKLKKQVRLLEENTDLGLVGTGYQTGDRNILNPLSDREIRRQMLFRCPVCHVSVVFRKVVWEKLGGYSESLPYGEDWDFWLRLGRISQLRNLPEVCVQLGNDTQSLGGAYFLAQAPILKKFQQDYGRDYPGRWRAIVYHGFVRSFFKIVPLNSFIHRLAQRVFAFTFVKKVD